MAKKKRNIGIEILEGIREIKRGEHGRVTNIPCGSKVAAPSPERPARSY
jgi:putative transcriptional regulator